MNKQRRSFLKVVFLVAAILASGGGIFASAGAALNVGDSAPPLQAGKWLQGQPITQFAQGTVYLVEFWASWSAPCRDAVPRLNEASEKYKGKGLVVIGQNCWEQDQAAAAAFINEMKVAFPVVLDDATRTMAKNWISAAGRSSLPAVFVVDKKGRVGWIGTPTELTDQVIEDLLAGKSGVTALTQPQPVPAKDPLAESEEQLSKLIAQSSSASIESAKLYLERAHLRARGGHWKEAEADLKQALQNNPAEVWAWYLLPPVLIENGETADYLKHTHEMLVRFGSSDNPVTAGRAAEGCLLYPGAGTNDLESARQIAERKIFPHWRRFYVGLAEYRLGHFERAVDWMQQIRNDLDAINGVDRWPCEANACLVLAMAQQQLKATGKAQEALTHAREIIDVMPKLEGSDLGRYWWNVLTTHNFLKETQKLVGGISSSAPVKAAESENRFGGNRP
jgi:thiol-disulfide isomerase/thioredoxin